MVDGKSNCDILIAGGGYVGLSLALALKSADPELAVTIVDIRKKIELTKDGRASAVAASARHMLNRLEVWSQISSHAQPINEMIVTDSKLRDSVRPVLLSFAGEIEDGEPFAHMVPNGVLVSAIYDRVRSVGVEIISPDKVVDFKSGNYGVEIKLESERILGARLLVAADGVRSKLREMAGIKSIHWNYEQSAIVTTVAHERPHNGRAEEHFLPAGPFAILPLIGNRSSLVWTEGNLEAKRLVECDDFTFEIELVRRFGRHLGRLTPEGPRKMFNLGLTLSRSFVANRFALVGDSAHGIHPIAGQGLNLGFRDSAALAEIVIGARRIGQDFGTLDVLEKYQQWRRFDTWQMGSTTDVLNRLFSNDNDLVRIFRDVGLGLVDRVPLLKRFFTQQAAGGGSNSPKLMTGKPI